MRDVLGFTEPARRHPRGELVAEVLDQHRGEVGLHQTGCDSDDAGRTDLAGELPREVDQRRLGEVVDAERPRVGTQTSDGGDVDDDARAFAERLLVRGAAPEDRRFQVDLEGLVVARFVDAERRPVVGVRRRVVDEDVERAEPLERGVDDTLPRSIVAGVRGADLDLAAHLGGGGFEPLLLAAVDHHLCTRCCELGSDRPADPPRGTCDERDLAIQRDVHGGRM
jgi:hypothetical protein